MANYLKYAESNLPNGRSSNWRCLFSICSGSAAFVAYSGRSVVL